MVIYIKKIIANAKSQDVSFYLAKSAISLNQSSTTEVCPTIRRTIKRRLIPPRRNVNLTMTISDDGGTAPTIAGGIVRIARIKSFS